jgi:DNA (cytosine-5)-methyltransferase 1
MEALERDGKLTGPGGRRRLRYLSLYSGQAGCTAAFERLGSDAVCVGYAEVDAAANALLRYRWPDTVRLGSVDDVVWADLRGHVDLVLGGPPCQSFSVAGTQRGLRDPRGSQILNFLRVVEAVKPRWFLMENVPGLLSTNDGLDFEVYLDAAVEELGYALAYRKLSAQHFGLPQRRQRVWIVGEHHRSAGRCAEILALTPGTGGHIEARRTKGWKAAPRRADRRFEEIDEPEVDWSLASMWLHEYEGVSAPTPMPFRPPMGRVLAFKPMQSADARGIAQSEVAAPTLSAASGGNCTPAILYRAVDARHAKVGDVASTIQVGPAGGWSVNAAPLAMHADAEGEPVLRRFTPLETLRLQNFPDDWQDGVRVGGKPLTDTDRFRLSGNAWSVAPAAWVLERLIAVHYAAPKEASD